jgi:hypothetical protein
MDKKQISFAVLERKLACTQTACTCTGNVPQGWSTAQRLPGQACGTRKMAIDFHQFASIMELVMFFTLHNKQTRASKLHSSRIL